MLAYEDGAFRRVACGLSHVESKEHATHNRPHSTGGLPSTVAIVVVTRNRCASLARTLAALQGLERAYPIVVVDNTSDDGTRRMVREQFPSVRLLPLGTNLGAAARDLGVRVVSEPYVAFADDDSWYAPGSLSRAVALFDAYPRLGLLMSRILVGPEGRLDPTCALMSRTPLPPDPAAPGFPILGFVACGAIVRRDAYLQAGGFHRRFRTGGEEALLAITMAEQGWALSYMPELVSHHYPSTKRDMERRYVLGERNRLWTAWLRRPVKISNFRSEFLDLRMRLHGLLLALAGLPWVLRQRRPISPALEDKLVMLEEQRQG